MMKAIWVSKCLAFRDTFLDEELHMAIAWKTVKLWEKQWKHTRNMRLYCIIVKVICPMLPCCMFHLVLHIIFLCPQAFLTAMMAPSCQGSKYQYLEETQVDGSMASKTDVKQAAWDPRGLLLNYYSRWKAAWQWKCTSCQTGTSLKVCFTKRGIIIFHSIIWGLRKWVVSLVELKLQNIMNSPTGVAWGPTCIRDD